MIVKIQRAIFGGTMLIYDKNRSVQGELPLTPEVAALLGGDLKGYFKASVDENGLLRIQGRVADRSW